MLFEFHQAIVDLLKDKLSFAIWDHLPDDIAEVPCVVVVRPEAAQTTTAVVFDLTADIAVLGRRQTAGDPESELIAMTDDVWTVLGGTRGTKGGGVSLGVVRVQARTVAVAGLDIPAYVITVESSAATC